MTDDPDVTQKVGDVANSNPFDSAVNHDFNDSEIEDHALFINATAAVAGKPPSTAAISITTSPLLGKFTPTAIPSNPSIAKHTPSTSATTKSVSPIASHQIIAYLATMSIVLNL